MASDLSYKINDADNHFTEPRDLFDRYIDPSARDLAIYRAMLRLRGQVAGYCRAPLLDLAPEQVERLRPLLEPIDAVAVA